MQDTFATKDVAEQIGVSETTIKTWVDKLGLEVDRDSRHGRRFTQTELDLLHTVKNLRDEGRGYQTITRVVGRAPDARQADPAEQPSAASRSTDERPTMDLAAITEQVTAAVVAAIRQDNDLARDYAVAARQVGQLESQVANLQERLDEARRLLTAGQGETDDLKAQLADEKQARIRAEAERDVLQAQVSRPWWRKLIGI